MQKTLALKIRNIFMAVCFLAGSLPAQNPNIIKGYYISTRGDSIAGQIDINKTGGDMLRFRPPGQKKWKNLPAKEVTKAAGEGGYYIVPQEIRSGETSEQVFVQKIAGGGYDLYQGKSPLSGTVFYFNSKDHPAFIRVNKLGYELQLKTLFDTCIQKVKTKTIRYGSNKLSKYFAEINQCAYPKEKPFSFNARLQSKFGIGLNVYYYNIVPTIADSYFFSGDYHKVNKTGAGLSFRFNLTKAFGIYTGFNYVDKRIKTDSMVQRLFYKRDEPGIPPYYTRDYYKFAMDLNIKYVEIPLGMIYTLLPYAKWSPVFNFGFTFQKPVVKKVENDFGYPICNSGSPCPHYPTLEPGHVSPTGVTLSKRHLSNFFGGIGLRRQLSANQQIEMKLEFYHQRELAYIGINQSDPSSLPIDMKTERWQTGLTYHYFFTKKP